MTECVENVSQEMKSSQYLMWVYYKYKEICAVHERSPRGWGSQLLYIRRVSTRLRNLPLVLKDWKISPILHQNMEKLTYF